jgi:hypothetical protein
VKKNFHFNDDSSIGRYSSSFDSSPPVDNLQRKTFISPIITDQDENENRRILHNEYETSIISPSNELPTYYEQNVPRKLSSISEITETYDSEPDLSHVEYFKPKRKAIITTIHQKPSPPVYPKRKPIIKTRRKIIRDDDNDSGSELKTKFSKTQFFFSILGVERSPSEKSFDDHNISKPKSPSSLSFSKVFVTSVSHVQPTDNEFKNPLPTSDSLLLTDIITPKPILKKYNQSNHVLPRYRDQKKTSSLLNNPPKTIPRTTIKQSKHDESLL